MQNTGEATGSEPTTPGLSAYENLPTFNPSELKAGLLTIIIRYYVPQGEQGRVALPRIDAYSMMDNRPRPAPSPYPPAGGVERAHPAQAAGQNLPDHLRQHLAFLPRGRGGQFNNADNLYVIGAVKNVDGRETVVALKVRPPAYPRTNDEFDKVAVRCWSANQGNPDTSTPFGMKDEELRRARDGFSCTS